MKISGKGILLLNFWKGLKWSNPYPAIDLLLLNDFTLKAVNKLFLRADAGLLTFVCVLLLTFDYYIR